MKKPRLVMVGNGMAGVRTLEELLKIEPDIYDITVFGAEPHPNYNRILLSPVLAGEQTIDEIVLNSFEWYAANHITLHAGKKVVDVDRARRMVRAVDAQGGVTEAAYDRLLLCTDGLTNMVPADQMEKLLVQGPFYDTPDRLIEAANANGGSDNITALLLAVEPTEVEHG